MFLAAALPQLYNSIQVRITATVDPLLAQMFTLENIGLRFVRKVVVHAEKAHGSDPLPAHQWHEMLINLIPKNNMSLFRWTTPHPLPSRLVKFRWQRQRNIECLEIIPKYVPTAWGAEQEDTGVDLFAELNKAVFPNLRAIRVTLSDAESASLACATLRCRNVAELHVDGCQWQNGDAHQDDDEEDGVVHDPLTGLMFGHMK